MLLLIVMGIFVIIIICIAAAGSSNHFTGSHFLTYASYVKLGITIVSYISWMNHQRTNTEELSIEIVLLDFAGGSLSMLQMSWESYNLDDWSSFSGDCSKISKICSRSKFNIV